MANISPLYNTIANKIKEFIVKNGLGADEAIPSETKLSKVFSVSRVTIRQAIEKLVDEDILYKVKGSGTYYKGNKIIHQMYKHYSFKEEMRLLNKVASTKVLEFMITEPTSEIAKILNLSPKDKIYYVKRLRYGDEDVLLLEETYMPLKLFPDITYEVMESSKYDYIENKGLTIKENFQEVIPIIPNEDIQNLLTIRKKTPIIYLSIYSTLADDTVFEYSKIYYRSDKYTFRLTATRGQ